MTEKIQVPVTEAADPVERMTGFWNQYSKQILIGLTAVVVIVGGYLAYKSVVVEPKEKAASESMRFAEEYFRKDSVKLALEGDNLNPGFLKIISKYSGTKAANLAEFYAGSCFLKMGDFKSAVTHLEAFSTSELLVKARAKSLLGDANAELGKKEEAAKLYKEAGATFDKDDFYSPQYLYKAGYLYESIGKNTEAIEMYKMIKEKYPSYKENDVDKNLGRLGAVE